VSTTPNKAVRRYAYSVGVHVETRTVPSPQCEIRLATSSLPLQVVANGLHTGTWDKTRRSEQPDHMAGHRNSIPPTLIRNVKVYAAQRVQLTRQGCPKITFVLGIYWFTTPVKMWLVFEFWDTVSTVQWEREHHGGSNLIRVFGNRVSACFILSSILDVFSISVYILVP
jgi:hypothetical protein